MKVRYNRIVSTGSAESEAKPKKTIKKTQDKKKDIVPLNQRIASAAKDKNLSNALQQWQRIEEEGIKPTAHTYCAMVNAFVRCGQLSKAEEFVETMERCIPVESKSREGHLITLTALLKGYFMSSAFSRSHALFNKIVAVSDGNVGSRTLDTYLRGCLKTGAFQQGLTAFESHLTQKSEMSKIYASKMMAIRLAVKSACEISGSDDASVCVHIGSGYIRLGKFSKAREWFDRAREILFTSAPDRQFDKLQKSEMVRICDFYTSKETECHITSSIDKYIGQFLAVDGSEQANLWRSLGLAKYKTDEEIKAAVDDRTLVLTERIGECSKKGEQVIVEVCSGSGEWIAREADKNRSALYIAVEFRFDRCVDILTRQMYQQLDNLWVLCGDARAISKLIPNGSVTELHVNYPEPPPINNSFIEEEMSSDIVTKKFLKEIIKPLLIPDSGVLHIVSDDKLYMGTVSNTVSDAWGIEVFPKSSKTLVDSYFARFFSKKAKRWAIEAVVPR
jgi:pentatricopeptide repeat protein